MPTIPGMKGKGFYDQNSAPQAASIRLLDGWLEEAVDRLPLPAGPWPLVVADFGCSEGRNAMGVMGRIVDRLRLRSERPILTIYSDLPSNDYSGLFARLNGPEAGSAAGADVYAGVIPGSFFRPLVPPGVVQLATCFNAILYLDKMPSTPVTDSMTYRRPRRGDPGRALPEAVVAAFSGQAAEDMTRFLTCRAREIVPGGKLLISTPGDDGDRHSCESVYHVLNDACLDLVAAGRISRDQYERITIPVYFRTVAEMIAPLEQDGSPVKGAFTVDRAETMEVPTPFVRQFREDGNADRFAEAYCGFLRAFTDATVRAVVGANVTDAVYDRVQERLRTAPERYLLTYVLNAALLTRR